MKRIPVVAVVVTSFGLQACMLTGSGLPSRIVAERGGFIPEGIEFDTNAQRLLTGSLVDGTIYEIGADGSLIPFVEDSALVSSIGIEADEPRDRLLVANADRDVFDGPGPGLAQLGVYRLSTGERIALVDLSEVADIDEDGIVFTNDVTVAADGTVFLTDTFMNQIYRVDTDYMPSLFYRFEPTTGLGLNGIVSHNDGYLIVVAIGSQGIIYKIPVDDPAAAQPVALSQPATGADGLVWAADGSLVVVSNSTSSIMAYRSADGWESAELVATADFEGQATTGAAVGETIYVVQPHFDDDDPPVILRLRL